VFFLLWLKQLVFSPHLFAMLSCLVQLHWLFGNS